jgi:4-hydroxy 2-oxovalerate aldolase
MKILDCTFRDGGYYTNWDFESEVVNTYLTSISQLPIDYLEVGYRSIPKDGYYGEFFYCPLPTLKKISATTNKPLAILLDEKDLELGHIDELLQPCIGIIQLVRIAVSPDRLNNSFPIAEKIKSLGFKLGFNVMYMSKWNFDESFISILKQIDGLADYFYMVDSYGGVFPEDIIRICNLLKAETNLKIGFHGHNNLELGLINTLTAIEYGADIVDVTVAGMGRGAGNLSTELLLTVLASKGQIAEFDFNELSKLAEPFYKLKEEYKWGTNLPYMFSGANSLPQKDVMDWVGKRYYSFNSIVRALENQTKGLKDNEQLPKFVSEEKVASNVLIIGGGESVKKHAIAFQTYLKLHPEISIIHASSKNALIFNDLPNRQYFCLIGNEGYRMESVFAGNLPQNAICILPPFPRKMGTYIPNGLLGQAFELSKFKLKQNYIDSLTAIAIQLADELKASAIELIGFDGYSGMKIGTKEQDLLKENDEIFKEAYALGLPLVSLTNSNYKSLKTISIYGLL